MYEISQAAMYHENRCIHEQSTALWDALLAGLTCRVHALLQRAPFAVARRAAVRQIWGGVAPRVRCKRAPSPEHGNRDRALSPRERQTSECTESGVPSTDPTAAPVPGRVSARRRAHRAEAGARRLIVLALACVGVLVQRNCFFKKLLLMTV